MNALAGQVARICLPLTIVGARIICHPVRSPLISAMLRDGRKFAAAWPALLHCTFRFPDV